MHERSQGGLVDLVSGCRGDAEFCGDRVDRVLCHAQVYPTVGGEVWADVALVVSLNFITGQPVEERGDVADGRLGLFGDRDTNVDTSQRRLLRLHGDGPAFVSSVEVDTHAVHAKLGASGRSSWPKTSDPGPQPSPLPTASPHI